jgi:hypothetical protein
VWEFSSEKSFVAGYKRLRNQFERRTAASNLNKPSEIGGSLNSELLPVPSSKRRRTVSSSRGTNNSVLSPIAWRSWQRLVFPIMKPNQSDAMVADALGSAGPEVALAKGVLAQAKQDLRRFRRAKDGVGREIYEDAYSWVTGNDFSWPYSFQNVCKALSLSVEPLRTELLRGNRTGWVSRSRRIAETISSSLRSSLGNALRGERSGARHASRPAHAH